MEFTSSTYRHKHVLEKQVELLYRQIPQVLVAVIIVASVITWLFYAESNKTYAIVWLSSVYLLTAMRLYFCRVRINNESYTSVKRWAQMGVSFSFLSGLQWAASVYVFFNADSIQNVAILTLVLLGMVAGAVGSLSVVPAAFFGFTTPIAISLMVAISSSSEPDIQFLVYLVLTFITVFSGFCRNTYKSNMYAIWLNIENTGLIKNLEIEKENAEKANIAKSNFLAAASHDLRQPLQSMSLCAEALKENLKDSNNLKLLDRVIKSHDSLQDLLNALLDICRLFN